MEEQQIKLTAAPRFLRLEDVKKLTSLSKSEIYRRLMDDDFPKPIKLSANRSAWIETEVVEWMNEQIAANRRAA
jgi:prophage regulatory protein